MTRFLCFFNEATRIGTRKRPLKTVYKTVLRRKECPSEGFRPRLEALEDRQLLSTFTVVLATDNGGPGGQMVTATTGDLRYCVEQADATHTATSDSIGFSSALTSQPTTITLNSANGPLVLSDSNPVTMDGVGMISVSGGGQVGVFNITSGNVTMNNLAIINGFTAGYGGGIFNQGTLTLNNCLLDHDSANGIGGGGIANYGGTITLNSCTFSNDSATYSNSEGGGLATFSAGHVAKTRVNGCTFSLCSAHAGGGMFTSSSDCVVTNCTFSNNSAFHGGAFVPFNNRTMTMINCTISGNSATSVGGGIWIWGPTTFNLINTIVAGNTATSSGPDISGTVATADHNLIGNASGSSGLKNGVNGNIVGGNGNPVINPMLGPLQNNGGPTQTMALLPGSPAIAAADNSMAPATDQRGYNRIDLAGETTDIGAFEVQSFDPPVPPKVTQFASPSPTAILTTPSVVGGDRNSSSWSFPQLKPAQTAVSVSTKTEFAALSRISHGAVGPADWAHPFFASESWLADAWLN